jgi:hypothetical protein
MNNSGISLGWNCKPAQYGVEHSIRNRKNNGYMTCPFDKMVSNYIGLVECINDDFKYFVDPEYLILKQLPNEKVVFNTKYKFWFNHESPEHANLYIKEKWKNGKNHFIENNYKYFIERYQNRINNFRNYLTNPKNNILFILNRYSTHTLTDIAELNMVIKYKYPQLKYSFKLLNLDTKEYTYNHLSLMGFTKDCSEIKRMMD